MEYTSTILCKRRISTYFSLWRTLKLIFSGTMVGNDHANAIGGILYCIRDNS
jgi:hypothetical protein